MNRTQAIEAGDRSAGSRRQNRQRKVCLNETAVEAVDANNWNAGDIIETGGQANAFAARAAILDKQESRRILHPIGEAGDFPERFTSTGGGRGMRSAANLPARVGQGLQEHPAPSQHILLARKTFPIQMNNVTRLFRGQRSPAR